MSDCYPAGKANSHTFCTSKLDLEGRVTQPARWLLAYNNWRVIYPLGGQPSQREIAMTTQTINNQIHNGFFGADECDYLQIIADAMKSETKSIAEPSFLEGFESITLKLVIPDRQIPGIEHYQYQINGSVARVTLSNFIETNDGSLKSFLDMKLHDEVLTRTVLANYLKVSRNVKDVLTKGQHDQVCTDIWRLYARLKMQNLVNEPT